MAKKGLGRRTPQKWDHVEKYPLSALPAEDVPTNVPVTIGVNWYSNFDNPVQGTDGKWRIGAGSLGSIRGGHCVCLRPVGVTDTVGWWSFYNQGQEGACVGFGSTRMMSLLNRVRYDPWWLWDEAKIADEWSDTNPGDDNGSSVHAAMDVLRLKGHVKWSTAYPWPGDVATRDAYTPTALDGISAVRWATSADQVATVLGYKSTPAAVPLLNSWGKDYPHVVWLPLGVLNRLILEDGEAALVTDR